MSTSHIVLDSAPRRGDSQIISASSVRLNLPVHPMAFYRHGWQSWSLSTWMDPARELPVMKPTFFHSRQTDPVYARYPHPNGSWLGAVELGKDDVLLLGALGLEAHVALREGQLQGWYEIESGDWFVGRASEMDVFARYAELLGKRLGKSVDKKPPRVWCSWYSLYDTISEEKLLTALAGLEDLPFDVFQIDDGWQQAAGDWEPNRKFCSGMDALAARIKASGRTAGLWLAPLIVGKSSSIYREHADWLLRNVDEKLLVTGFEWSSETFALDTTHPEVREWLRNLILKVRGWGYEYLKLDFLFAGALPGKRYVDMPREAAYRQALEIIRQAAGNAYLTLCGTPILPSLGLCDAIRIGPDAGNWWDSRFYSFLLYNQTAPGLKNSIRTSLHRLWLAPLVNADPDVAFFSENETLTSGQKELFLDLTAICGVKATSDLPQTWTESQRSNVRRWLEASPQVTRTGRYTFLLDARHVDFSHAVPLPSIPRYLDSLLSEMLGWLGNQIWILKIWHWYFRYSRSQ